MKAIGSIYFMAVFMLFGACIEMNGQTFPLLSILSRKTFHRRTKGHNHNEHIYSVLPIELGLRFFHRVMVRQSSIKP